ncbi:MAG TPA: hypothetical protein VHJ19_12800 [Gammaproteobacteria bacterium]|jgi:hemolysin activation/secretion protein|nr:hypothetical protein [Gammaproteobacteria bacterium]
MPNWRPARTGGSILNLRVEEGSPYDFAFVVANGHPPSVGAEHAEIYVARRNLTGWSDTLELRYSRMISGAEDIVGFYTRPLIARIQH